MTLREYREALEKLSPEELERFNDEFGGGQKTIDERLRGFVDHPEHERRLCQLLNLKTEDEKLTEAACRSAKAAERSASVAIIACVIALVSVIVGVFV